MTIPPLFPSIEYAMRAHERASVELRAVMRHIYAGERDHYSDDCPRVKVFKPVVSELQFFATGEVNSFMTFRSTADTIEDADAYWSTLRLPTGISLDEARQLQTSLIEEHRTLTGEIRTTFEQIEVKPDAIEKITESRATLAIGYQHLADYLSLRAVEQDMLLAAYMRRPDDPTQDEVANEELAVAKDASFRASMLTAPFLRNPCDRATYETLLQEYRTSNCGGMDFGQYYAWFKESESNVLGDTFKPEFLAQLKEVLVKWSSDQGSTMSVALRKSWAARNFNIHPQHRPILSQLVDEMRAPAPRSSSRPRP